MVDCVIMGSKNNFVETELQGSRAIGWGCFYGRQFSWWWV